MIRTRRKSAAVAFWALGAAALGTIASAAWIAAEAAQDGPDRIAVQAREKAAPPKTDAPKAADDEAEAQPDAPEGMMGEMMARQMGGMRGMGGGMGMGGGGMMGGMGMPNIYMNGPTYIQISQLAAELAEREEDGLSQDVFETLNTKIKMKLPRQTSLQFAIKYVQGAVAKAGRPALPIYLDLAGAQAGQGGMSTSVEMDLEGVPLKTSLRWLLKQMGLAYCVRDGVLFIGSARGVRNELAEAVSEVLANDPESLDPSTRELLKLFWQGR